MAAALWLLDQTDGPIVIGGESAGAHLTLTTALGLREKGLGDRIAGLVGLVSASHAPHRFPTLAKSEALGESPGTVSGDRNSEC